VHPGRSGEGGRGTEEGCKGMRVGGGFKVECVSEILEVRKRHAGDF